MTKEERYVKKLVKKKSFETVKDSVKIGEVFIHGVVVGFHGTMVAYASVKDVKNGNLSEKTIYFIPFIEYLYQKTQNNYFYIGYKDDLKIAVKKNKLTDKYVRSLNTELSLESLKYSQFDSDDLVKLPWLILAVGPILSFIIMFCGYIETGVFVLLLSLILFGVVTLLFAISDRLFWR